MARLFFALWPDEAAARRLSSLALEFAAQSRGKAVALEKIHLTLIFLGEVDETRIPGLLALPVAGRALPMRLDVVGAFRKARVAWAGAVSLQPELIELQANLGRQLAGAGFALEDRPFAPHVTLVRKTQATVPGAPVDAIGWTAGEVALVRSDTASGRYSTVRLWKLGG